MFTASFAIPNEAIEQMARKNDGASAKPSCRSILSCAAILLANHAAPCCQELGGMLLHPLGDLRRAHQAGLHPNVGEVRPFVGAVLDVSVVGIPDRDWGEIPVGFVQIKPGHQCVENDLIASCR